MNSFLSTTVLKLEYSVKYIIENKSILLDLNFIQAPKSI